MGAYLSEPIKEKESEEGNNVRLSYGASCMQGWRVNQEDAHNTIVDYDRDMSLFAVYDGHGGAEVSKLMAQDFPDYLKANKNWNKDLLGKAMVESFLGFDASLLKKEQVAKLCAISGLSPQKDDDQESDGEDKVALLEEACLPLEQVLKKYGFAIEKTKKGATTLRSVAGGKGGALQQFLSPMIKKSKCKTKKDVGGGGDVKGQNEHVEDEEEGPPSPPCSPEPMKAEKRKSVDESDECSILAEIPDVKRIKTTDIQKHNGNGKLPEPQENGSATPKSRRCFSECANMDDTPAIVENKHEHVNNDKLTEDKLTPKKEKSQSPKKVSPQTARTRSSKSESDATKDADGPVHGWADVSDSARATGTPETATAVSTSDEESEADADFNASAAALEREDETEESSMTDEDTSTSDGESEDERQLGSVELVEGEINAADDDDEYPMPSGDTPGVDSGTTACVAVIGRNRIVVANAGDSRCVMCRDGVALDLSVDHKPEDDIETERIHGAGGKITPDGRVNGGLNLSRAVGDHFYKRTPNMPLEKQMISPEPDIRTENITDKDSFVVVACDGIWNSMTSQEVIDFVKEKIDNTPLPTICEQMCDYCLADSTMGDGTGCDNMTVIIIKLNVPDSKSAENPDVKVQSG